MALTKVTGHVIKSDTNITSHNINSSGIVTAITFDGNFTGVAVTFTGDSTIGSLGITTNLTVGGNIDVDGQTNLDHVSIAGVTTVTGEIKIPDLSGSSNKISLGTNQNLQIYYDSSSYITNGTAGHLFLKTLNGGSDIRLEANDDIFLMTAAGSRNSIICRDYAQVELYYNNTKRLETTNTGAIVSGILTVTGNMNVEGVLTYQDVTNIDSIGIVTARSDIRGGRNLSVVGIVTANQIKFADSNFGASTNQLRFGSSDDMLIYHDGNNSVIKNQTNDLYIETVGSGDDIIIKSADDLLLQVAGGEDGIKIIGDGAVELYHNGTNKAYTQSSGLAVNGSINLYDAYPSVTWEDTNHNSDFRITNNDGTLIVYDITRGAHVLDFKPTGDLHVRNDKGIYFGESNDLLIGHDGTSTRIEDSYGFLAIKSNALELQTYTGGEVYAKFTRNGAVELRYDNAIKLTTSATGIDVTGEVAATQDYPNFRPTLDLNFAAEKKLDPRITYQRSGPASFVNEFGKVVLVGDNAPRFDHDPTTRESKGLLIEESRTNVAPYTDLSQYGGHNFTSTANNAVAPDGTTTATKVEHGGSGTSYLDHINNSINAAGAGSYTYSVWLKAPDDQPDGYYGCRIAVLHSTGGNVEPTVSLNKTWTRYSVTKTFGASDPGKLRVHLIMFRTSPGGTYDGKVVPSYVWAWGAQIEAGAFATSYIPTAGATRGNESFEIDGEDFTDFFNATESTVLSHITPLNGSLGNHSGTGGVVWSFDAGGSFGNGNYLSNSNSTTAFGHTVVVGSSGQNTGGGTGNMTNGVPFKNATIFKKDDFIMATNGTLASADTSGNLPTVVKLMLGNNGWGNSLNGANIHFNRFAYYPKRLPNTQLVTLTS